MKALAEVNCKIALVESLLQRILREALEEIAGEIADPLLRLDGSKLASSVGNDKDEDTNRSGGGSSGNNMVILATTRDKAERLLRQSCLPDAVARRVESTLRHGFTRMESAKSHLSRVLPVSPGREGG